MTIDRLKGLHLQKGDLLIHSLKGLVNLSSPKIEEVDIGSISIALSNTCRFNGNVNFNYSVAQHSVLVSEMLPDRLQLHGLMHDAHEAYIGDMITPVKALLMRSIHDFGIYWQEIEEKVDDAIFGALGITPIHRLPKEDRKMIKEADTKAFAVELYSVVGKSEDYIKSLNLPETDLFDIMPMSNKLAYATFLNTFLHLTTSNKKEVNK